MFVFVTFAVATVAELFSKHKHNDKNNNNLPGSEVTGILNSMSFFATVTPAPSARSLDARRIALLYAGLLVIMVLGQLFTFEEFVALLGAYQLPGGDRAALVSGSAIVVLEVFALPFLLSLPLSRAFRWVSLACGWLVSLTWLLLSLWAVLTGPSIATIGLIGTVLPITVGWWAVCISLALGVIAAWTSWGMWPGHSAAKGTK